MNGDSENCRNRRGVISHPAMRLRRLHADNDRPQHSNTAGPAGVPFESRQMPVKNPDRRLMAEAYLTGDAVRGYMVFRQCFCEDMVTGVGGPNYRQPQFVILTGSQCRVESAAVEQSLATGDDGRCAYVSPQKIVDERIGAAAEVAGAGYICLRIAFKPQKIVRHEVCVLAGQNVDAARKLVRQPFVIRVQKGNKGVNGCGQPPIAGSPRPQIFLTFILTTIVSDAEIYSSTMPAVRSLEPSSTTMISPGFAAWFRTLSRARPMVSPAW